MKNNLCPKCNHPLHLHNDTDGNIFQCYERNSIENNDFCGCQYGKPNTLDRTIFRIPIGDWSKDGHGHCDYYTASSVKSLTDIREAYFAAKKKLPKLICPEEFVNEYEDGVVPKDVILEAQKLGYNFGDAIDPDSGEIEYFSTGHMAKYIVWYINQGDPDCDAKLEGQNDMLVFYGFDEKGRHISAFGYGLLGS